MYLIAPPTSAELPLNIVGTVLLKFTSELSKRSAPPEATAELKLN